ncbi:hypothetical protein CI109_101806 [Kwoniella shandongensis]|uniref:Uncharacterized protein n=1 Tax=Kwoniella shandongensis TaxID=1734106 RepID=A0A5M6C918_9TREE|nr:uncharacterized protein CI109_001072 [Kwoniella shandongensis]KAA5530272.1 hypothetical protein CI109_001072 [Kwoniella shandongensis]
MSEAGPSSQASRPSVSPPPQPPPNGPTPIDPLFHSARIKLSSRDQEAMRKLRSTMMERDDSGSSTKSNSPSSPVYPANSQASSIRGTRSRTSTLSRQVVLTEPTENEGVDDQSGVQSNMDRTPRPSDGLDTTPRPNETRFDRTYEPTTAGSDYVIAVLGHQGVGKTTVISKALRPWGMSEPMSRTFGEKTATSYTSQITPGGKIQSMWKVEFLEMDILALNLASDGTAIWPQGTPSIAGVIFCYDATRSSSLAGLSDALKRLAARNLPMVILACKSDPDANLEVDAPQGNAIGEPHNIGLIEVTTNTAEGKSKMRNALRWLLYKLEQRQRRHQRKLATIVTTTQPFPSSSGTATPAELEGITSPTDSDASSSGHRLTWKHGLNMTSAETDGETASGHDAASDRRSSSSSMQWMVKAIAPIDKEKEEGRVEEEKSAGQAVQMERTKTAASTTSGETATYINLEDLLNQLFTALVSNKDDSFIRAFLMTYRRFCLPHELMQEFLDRFREVEDYAVSSDVKNWALMKLTGAVIDWTTQYPGDLQDPSTQSLFRDILALVLKYTFMAHLTGDLISVEQSLFEVVDIDQSWSIHASAPPSAISTTGTELVIGSEVLYDFDSTLGKSDSNVSVIKAKTSTHAGSSGSTSSVNVPREPSHRTRSNSEPRLNSALSPTADDTLVHTLDETGYARWAGAVNLVLSSDPKAFATELTRMQWELFVAIRPRDVFRHDFGKETDGPVGKSILFFNHISRWVSTIILANPKAKHRARVIERFILIAHQLRRLYNYDTLYAVISGLRETSVHRLATTQSLVSLPPSAEKEYQSHLKLMDPRGGYVHYRRALEADITNGRAAIPLLTNILGLVNRLQGVRPEDRRKEDGKIQWDKFARFGEILGILEECKNRGPIVRGEVGEGFRRAIRETPIISNEDALWERSQLLEPSGGTIGGKVMKRLATFGF